MRGSDCIAQAVHCALLSLHHMCNLTHTKAIERRNREKSDIDKDSDYRGMKIIRFKNIFWVSPMGMIP